jgi:hypothetical protein
MTGSRIFLPEQTRPVYVRKGFAGPDDRGGLVREGVVLPHGVAAAVIFSRDPVQTRVVWQQLKEHRRCPIGV